MIEKITDFLKINFPQKMEYDYLYEDYSKYTYCIISVLSLIFILNIIYLFFNYYYNKNKYILYKYIISSFGYIVINNMLMTFFLFVFFILCNSFEYFNLCIIVFLLTLLIKILFDEPTELKGLFNVMYFFKLYAVNDAYIELENKEKIHNNYTENKKFNVNYYVTKKEIKKRKENIRKKLNIKPMREDVKKILDRFGIEIYNIQNFVYLRRNDIYFCYDVSSYFSNDCEYVVKDIISILKRHPKYIELNKKKEKLQNLMDKLVNNDDLNNEKIDTIKEKKQNIRNKLKKLQV
jgi:hypothetical protein